MRVALVVTTLEAVIVRRVNRVFLGPGGDIVEGLDEAPKGRGGWASGLDQTDLIRVVEIDKMDVVAAGIGQFYDAAKGLTLNSKGVGLHVRRCIMHGMSDDRRRCSIEQSGVG